MTAWQSAPDTPGLWWRDGGDGLVAWEVRVSPLRRGCLFAQEAVGEECDTIYDLSPRSGVRWTRCLPPEILAPGEPTRAELAAQLAAVTQRAEFAEARDRLAQTLDAEDPALRAAADAEGSHAVRAAALAAARREGAEAMREAILDALPCVTAESDRCAAVAHTVPVPGDATGGDP